MPRSTERPEAELHALRERVEQIDADIIALIAERARCAREIGVVKHALGLPTLDPAREAEVLRRAGALARSAGLPSEQVRELFWAIIALARDAQQDAG